MPDRVMGASDGGLSLVTIGGVRPSGERFSVVELLSGAWGGQAEHEGQDGVPNLGANVSNIPVEMLEAAVPVRVERYGYVPDTGGAGRHRGGLSLEREYTFLGESVLSVRADREAILPYGIGAGQPGTPSANRLVTDGRETRLPSKFSRTVADGDRFYHRTAGAGGWGDPLEREPPAVAADVRNGILSVERARAEYGVVILPDGGTPDLAATDAERDRLRARRPDGAPASGPTGLADRAPASRP
jgi:N-methylhydantoinase B